MNKNAFMFGVIGLIVGLAIGFYGANYLNRNTQNQTIATPNSNAPVKIPGGAQQRPQVALADVQIVLDKAKNEPENFDAQNKAGEMYSRIQRFDKALEFYEKAQKIKPGEFESNSKLGNAYFDAKEYEKAETFYLKALEINPKDPAVRTDLGLTFFLREPGDTDRAIKEFRKSLELDPNHELTLQNLSAALKDKGDEEELRKTLERLKKVNPNNPVLEKYSVGG